MLFDSKFVVFGVSGCFAWWLAWLYVLSFPGGFAFAVSLFAFGLMILVVAASQFGFVGCEFSVSWLCVSVVVWLVCSFVVFRFVVC